MRRLFALAFLGAFAAHGQGFVVLEDGEQIRIRGGVIEAAVRKSGYVSGVAAGSFLDKATGFRDPGFGLAIADWLAEPGSDEAYRASLPETMRYFFGNLVHGNIPKRIVEGPQICTQARRLSPRVIRGPDFVAVKMRYAYTLAAPGREPGSVWEQTLVFPEGKRWFFASDEVTLANGGEATFLRVDMPGHIRHKNGDTFARVYLSYEGVIPSEKFTADFAPDEQYRYVRKEGEIPKRFIRGYRLRDPRTGREGPYLAGMTLDPSVVSEAWCHQRGYVSMIEEIGGRPLRKGGKIQAAYLIGYFDSLEEMDRVFDQHAGPVAIEVSGQSWRLVRNGGDAPPAAEKESRSQPASARRESHSEVRSAGGPADGSGNRSRRAAQTRANSRRNS
jgi:hypothetical protein